MDDLSVSKGVFAHCKRPVVGKKPVKKRKSDEYMTSKPFLQHKSEPWYEAYSEISLAIDRVAAEVHDNTFRQLLYDLRDFVVKIKNMPLLSDEISTGILLAGVNLPDHDLLLQKLVGELESVTPYVATAWSRDAVSLKHLTEEVVYQIINQSNPEDYEVKKSNCTFCALNAWHQETNNGETPLVILIADFESFCPTVLHDFILILSSYMTTIKFVLIFGVATTLHIIHRSLSYDATSKLKCQVFRMKNQVEILENVLDGIISSPDIPFKIIGGTFDMLVDIFLWYNFSVEDFLKSCKICLWRHFYNSNEKIICCKKEVISENVARLTNDDFNKLKKLASIKEYLDQSRKGKKVTDARFKEIIMDLLEDYLDYMNNFLLILRCLFKLSCNVGFPFGKTFRQLYVTAIGQLDLCETPEYKKATQLMFFLSREEILSNILMIISHLEKSESIPKDITTRFGHHYDVLKSASEVEIEEENKKSLAQIRGRSQLLNTLKHNSLTSNLSDYKKAKIDFKNFLNKEFFQNYLRHPRKVPIHEIFCFNDLGTVQHYIKGSTKASIYNSLNDPHILLPNTCCVNQPNISQHPDINIIYALHMENRKMINMYDWLQAFVCIVDPTAAGEEKEIDPLLQARFSRAVAELQFLGFIKPTRRKTDHVKRLTV
ncbi:origin recognition complex subunit 3 [Copidosoma floridanum]|uniref:origin recognition complex subunit 3 n=1 Tax=Copidosoma floridanum TaxID=29053 RepID=UPI0006C97254|nr:origin recognition complex subunit 3 [Copidosoma floridanum]